MQVRNAARLHILPSLLTCDASISDRTMCSRLPTGIVHCIGHMRSVSRRAARTTGASSMGRTLEAVPEMRQ